MTSIDQQLVRHRCDFIPSSQHIKFSKPCSHTC